MSFFNDLGKKISTTTSNVVEKTKTSTDTLRLNGLVSDEERNINNAYLNIGKKYVELHAEQPEEDFAEQFAVIAESRKKIDEYKAQIRKNKKLLLCQNCGAEIPETVLFCTKCGAENPVGKRMAEERAAQEAAERAAREAAAAQAAAQAQAQAAQAAQPYQAPVTPAAGNGAAVGFCTNCGKPRMAGAMFCTGCGNRFVDEAAAAPAAVPMPVVPEAATEAVPTPVVPEAATEAVPTPVVPEAATEAVPTPVVPEAVTESVPTPVVSETVTETVVETPTQTTVSTTEETIVENTGAGKICPTCGKPVPAENRFCTCCGTKMAE